MELDEFIELVKEQQGIDLSGVLTTADKIGRPERALDRDAFDDFNKRNPMAGGGMLVQPGFGGVRQGYSGRKLTDLKNYGERGAKKITIDGKDYRLNTKGPNTGKVSFQTTKKGKDITLYLTPQQLKKRLKNKGSATSFQEGQATKLAEKINKNLNTWSKNWVKNNIKNYGVRDFKNFTTDMASAWAEELKNNPNKYPSKFGVGTRLTNELGLPVVRGGFQIEGITFPQRPDRPGFNPELTWQKLFINNKLKDKDFKAKVNSYLDWNLTKKVEGGAGSMTKTAALDYGKFKKGFDDDVIYLMGEVLNNRALNPGGGQVGINDVFKKVFGKKGEAYFKKYEGSWSRWRNNFFEVASLAGLDKSQADALLQKQINDSKKIMSLFNVKNLPPEFVVAQDHLFGLAEAKALGDPKIARQTLQALVATTKEQNRILGQEGFSNKRVNLIKKFKNASLENKANIVNQLNTLAEEYVPGRLQYNVKKDGSLKITNLQPETTLIAKKEAYKNLAKNFPKPLYKKLMTFCPKSNGGEAGVCTLEEAMDGLVSESKQLKSGNMNEAQAKKTAQKIRAVTRVGTGATLMNLLGPYGLAGEVVIDGGLIANRMLSDGDTYKEALSKSLIKYAMPKDARERLEKETDLNTMILGSDTKGLAADFVDALKKDEDLKQKYENYLRVNQEDMSSLQDPYSSGTTPMFSTGDKNKALRELMQALERSDPTYGKNIYDIMKFGTPERQAFETKQEVFDAQKMQNRMDYDRKILGPLKDLFGTGFYSPEQLKQLELKADRDTAEIGLIPDELKTQQIANYGGVANLAKGGRAGYKTGSVRKGVLSLIDESLKKTPKDTTTRLDKLIKETLDEDLFDKKDRIVDSINISEAKKRRNYPYNIQVFEEPKNLDFYRDIKESNFKTKTGPYYDRIRRLKKAGGGLLKQAGDRSGAPPESGPNSQGLQGLLNRGKNI